MPDSIFHQAVPLLHQIVTFMETRSGEEVLRDQADNEFAAYADVVDLCLAISQLDEIIINPVMSDLLCQHGDLSGDPVLDLLILSNGNRQDYGGSKGSGGCGANIR